MTRAFQKIYTKIDNITKATVTLRATGVGNDELATVGGRLAQVVKIMGDSVTLQVFAGTEGLATNSEVIFQGEPPKLRVSDNLAGRFFNAYGEPLEGGEPIEGEAREIGGPTVNPFRRLQPSELIATGIAGIDLNNTIVTGQKIPFFADSDQPYNAVMANVALSAKADKIILGGMGLTNDDFLYFKQVFENAGALDRIVSFVNTTENPPVERLLVPDMALTAAAKFSHSSNGQMFRPNFGLNFCQFEVGCEYYLDGYKYDVPEAKESNVKDNAVNISFSPGITESKHTGEHYFASSLSIAYSRKFHPCFAYGIGYDFMYNGTINATPWYTDASVEDCFSQGVVANNSSASAPRAGIRCPDCDDMVTPTPPGLITLPTSSSRTAVP